MLIAEKFLVFHISFLAILFPLSLNLHLFSFVFSISHIGSLTSLSLSHCCQAPLICLNIPGTSIPYCSWDVPPSLALLPLHPGNSFSFSLVLLLGSMPIPPFSDSFWSYVSSLLAFLDLPPCFCGACLLVACWESVLVYTQGQIFEGLDWGVARDRKVARKLARTTRPS